ncbi:MAG: hypothetical protein ACOC2U_02905 [bacterium]
MIVIFLRTIPEHTNLDFYNFCKDKKINCVYKLLVEPIPLANMRNPYYKRNNCRIFDPIWYYRKSYYERNIRLFAPIKFLNSRIDNTQHALSVNDFCKEVFDLDLCLKHLIMVY